MKKFLIVLMVLCTVSSAVFAIDGLSINAGAGFDFVSGKTAKDEKLGEASKYSFPAVAVKLGAEYAIDESVSAYANADILFPLQSSKIDDLTVKDMYDEIKEHDKNATCTLIGVKAHLGALYALPFEQLPFDLSVGGGLLLDLHSMTLKAKDGADTVKMTGTFTNIGLEAVIKGEYHFTDKVGLALNVNPQLMILNIMKSGYGVEKDIEYDKLSGIGLGFGVQAAVSGVYHF